jgi:hypothetical protein
LLRLEQVEKVRASLQKLLVEQGLALTEEDSCPLCDNAWDINELKAHLEEKLAKATAAASVMDDFASATQPILENLENVALAASKIAQACPNADPVIDAGPLSEFITRCGKDRAAIEKARSDPDGMADARVALKRTGDAAPSEANDVVVLLRRYVDSLPEPSKEEAAKEFLIVAEV